MVWERAKRPSIAVCIPHTGMFYAEFCDRTYVPLKAFVHRLFNKSFFMSSGLPVNIAREGMVENALRIPEITHIYFQDTDLVPETPPDINEAIASLLSCNIPIACGLYRAKQKEGFNYAIWTASSDGKKFTPVQGWKGDRFKADVTGLGSALIQRQVFEKTPRPWFPWDLGTPSEDFSFYLKAKKAGFDCWIIPSVRFSHLGNLKVRTQGTVEVQEV